jgi:AcrR family transcriptional regulator
MTEKLDKDVRRDQILDAARKLFSTKGFDSTSVDEIAKEAGLSKGAIYWHFESKLQILIAVAERFETEGQETLVQMAAQDQFGPEALYKVHRVMMAKHQGNTEADMLHHQLISLSMQYPEIRAALQRNQETWTRVVSELLDEAVAIGHFRPFDTKLVAEAISALYRGTCMLNICTTQPIDVIEYATKLFYDALVCKKEEAVTTVGQHA